MAAGIIGLRGYPTGLTEAGEFVNLSSIVRPLKRASWVFVLAGIAALTSAGLALANDLESAIVIDLGPGNYTAVLSGVNGATGVALVEAYHLQ